MQVDGRKVPLRTIKVRGLLAILLLTPNTLIAADTIVSRLWDDEYVTYRSAGGRESPPDRSKTLQIHVTRLRNEFRRAGVTAKVINDQKAYRLEVDASNVDYHRFRQLAAEGRRVAHEGDHQHAVAALAEATELWHGVPFAELTTSWAQRQRDTLTQAFLQACYQLVESHLALGQYDQAAERLEPLIAEHNVDETLAEQWMRAKAATDGPAFLSGYFRRFAERLRREMDADPNDHLTALYERLLQDGIDSETTIFTPHQGTVPHQLPRATPYFAGRRDTLMELDELLLTAVSSAPVIAIDGPPGIGKTAVVLEWANAHRDHYPGGQLFTNLSGHGPSLALETTAVVTSFLAALGTPAERLPPGSDDRAALLRDMLGDRKTLIVLDNARDSEHVRPILAATRSATVLVTSRQQLTGLVHRDGAKRITLGKLRPQESLALLSGRLGTSRAAPDSTAMRDLAELCDGLPLGLSIAAEHVAASPNAPLKELVEALRRQRRLLLDAGVHGDDDAASLRAVFSWSYDALRPAARTMFVLLGLHPTAQISVGAAAATADVSVVEATRTLDRLLGAHLVDQQAAGRFRLHDLIFLFASELATHLDDDVRTAAIHRVLDWYLATTINAVRCLDPHRVEVPAMAMTTGIVPGALDSEEQALRWCVDERANILAISRFAADTGFHDHAWRLIGEFDEVLNRYGHPSELLDIHNVALASARASGVADGIAGLLNNIGSLYFHLGDYEQAARYFSEAREAYGEINDAHGEAVSMMNVASTWLERGRYKIALDSYQRSLALFEQVGDLAGQAHNRHRIGDTYRRLHRTATASRYYMESLRINEKIGHLRGQGAALAALGELHLDQDEPTVAISYCEQAITFHRRALDERRIGETLHALAVAYHRIHRPETGIPLVREAVECHGATGNRRRRAAALNLLGQLYYETNNASGAKTAWTEAVWLLQELGDLDAETVQRRIDGLDAGTTQTPPPRTTPPEWVNDGLGDHPTAHPPGTAS